jgi:uncharacterized protein YegP (UPF0339 family)
MTEFSRRVDVQIIKDDPMTLAEYITATVDPDDGFVDTEIEKDYRRYLERFQPYRWRAVAANSEPIAHGESYFNEADCLNAVELLCGDETTVYWAPMFGEDRSEKLLRYGITDREHQQAGES